MLVNLALPRQLKHTSVVYTSAATRCSMAQTAWARRIGHQLQTSQRAAPLCKELCPLDVMYAPRSDAQAILRLHFNFS